MYSNVTRSPTRSMCVLTARIKGSSGKVRFTGMSFERSSFVAAWSEMARRYRLPSEARRRICGTSPTVEIVIRFDATWRPRGSVMMSSARMTAS
jgi:hypothetical protein